MTVDEMDLASQAMEVAPWQPEAYERTSLLPLASPLRRPAPANACC